MFSLWIIKVSIRFIQCGSHKSVNCFISIHFKYIFFEMMLDSTITWYMSMTNWIGIFKRLLIEKWFVTNIQFRICLHLFIIIISIQFVIVCNRFKDTFFSKINKRKKNKGIKIKKAADNYANFERSFIPDSVHYTECALCYELQEQLLYAFTKNIEASVYEKQLPSLICSTMFHWMISITLFSMFSLFRPEFMSFFQFIIYSTKSP